MQVIRFLFWWTMCLTLSADLPPQPPSTRRTRQIFTQGTISTLGAEPYKSTASLSQEPNDHGICDHFLLHFQAKHLRSARSILSSSLNGPIEYIPFNTLRVFACEADLQSVPLAGLLWFHTYEPHQKRDRSLSHKVESQSVSGVISLTVFTHPEPRVLDRWSGSPKLSAVTDIHKVHEQKYLLRVADPSKLLAVVETLTAQPEVKYVGRTATFHNQNQIATTLMQSDTIGPHPIWERNLTGMGQLAHVGDTGLDYDSCFFRDETERVEFYPSFNPKHRKVFSYMQSTSRYGEKDHTDPPSAHGTHVAGSVAGQSLESTHTAWNGMAYEAKVFFTDLSASQSLLIPPDFDLFFRPALDLGARISSNSWGSNQPTTAYVDTDWETDLFAYNNQGFLIVMAAGNTGARGLLSPGSSKNALSVGASYNAAHSGPNGREWIASFSAKGPTYDGRIKPDVIAPGFNIRSACSDGVADSNQCQEESKSGTSMSAPLVAGTAVLVRQYFYDGWYPSGRRRDADGFEASAALVKGMIIHSANPMHGRGHGEQLTDNVPDKSQGFGLMQIDRVLRFHDSDFRLYVLNNATLQHHGLWTMCFSAASGLRLKATLTWIDAMTAVGAQRSISNDLDLAVDNGAQFWKANNNRAPDAPWEGNNIVERVDVSEPPTGLYKVAVYGKHIPQSFEAGQPFALVVTGKELQESAQCPQSCGYCVHGKCVGGQCQCSEGYHHVDCSLCDEDVLCNGHGQCNPTDLRQCTCDPHFVGQRCTECASGWYGPNCDSDCQCHHGKCNTTTGICSCDQGPDTGYWGGAKCDHCSFNWYGDECKEPSHWCRNYQVIHLRGGAGILQVTGNPQYVTNMVCRWVINPEPCERVNITFEWVDTELNYDPIYIMPFPEVNKKKRYPDGRLSGSITDPKTYQSVPGAVLHIYFESDITNVARGFVARYECVGSHPQIVTETPTPIPLPRSLEDNTTERGRNIPHEIGGNLIARVRDATDKLRQFLKRAHFVAVMAIGTAAFILLSGIKILVSETIAWCCQPRKHQPLSQSPEAEDTDQELSPHHSNRDLELDAEPLGPDEALEPPGPGSDPPAAAAT